MSIKMITCLFCQSINRIDEQQAEKKAYGNCQNCGMPLSKETPNSTGARKKRFLPFFWFVVVFCLVMIFYLPR
ncbi:DnrP protein [Colwellia sp. 1_MG-2023]|uniref:DnrP protein n=1 Tax=Colwellia sp. 1_MG-2023 TaxID=3062649 RepID=UPI0026E3CCBE|nr:DnrP protein [Colwellia sp. 1_MG-2023]MDO6444467.1 DnrP protein [Colwellia sp. 1_MG-2023]